VVEDHDAVRTVAMTVLRRNGYSVFAVRGGLEALLVSQEHHGQIDLLLADLFMPYMNGVELAQRLVVDRPHLKVLFTSGSLMDGSPIEDDFPTAGFLPKPFRPDDLLRAVRRLLDV
jgi:CheY-like chemotaxis protein